MRPIREAFPPTLTCRLALAAAGLAAACGDPVPVPTTVTVSPATVTFGSFGEIKRLTATVKDQDGQAMQGLSVTWTSENESVATVDTTGAAKATGNGTATVRASVEDVSGTAEVTVEQRVAAVHVSPNEGELWALGDTIRLTATATDANGHAIEGADVTWSSDDESVATVDADGLVTAAGEGTTRVRAAAEGVEGSATVRVDLQRGWLLEFYEATGGTDWNNDENWGTDAPLNRWYGIRTNSRGDVTVLSLSANGLTGSIPSVLGNFQTLDSLFLDENELTGAIPPEIGNLQNLGILSLRGNRLTGSLRPEIGNLQNTQFLFLQENQLTGSIPPELGNLEELLVLNLAGNQLTGSIPPELGNLQSIGLFFLEGNRLTGAIPPELGNLEELLVLSLADNQLSGSIPPELGGLGFLISLDLSGNADLTDALPRQLMNLLLLLFHWNDTDLCAPADHEFQAWLRSIFDHEGAGDCDS